MNLSTEDCPPVEEIAAFLDGKLSGEERTRMVAHLADCESCYVLFAEAARFHLAEEWEDERPENAPREIVPFPRKRLPQWVRPIAASLLLGLATIPIYRSYTEMPSLLAEELVDPRLLAAGAGEPWSEGDMRGGESNLVGPYNALDFLTGVHLVDLHLTLARNDSEAVNVLSRLHKQFDNFIVAPEETRSYDRMREEIDAGKPPSSQLDEAARLDASLTQSMREADSPFLAFGKWVEAGRLAAIARQPGFFEDRDNRRFFNWLIRHEEQNLAPGIVRALKEIRGLLKNGEPRYDALRERFEAILRHYEAEAATP